MDAEFKLPLPAQKQKPTPIVCEEASNPESNQNQSEPNVKPAPVIPYKEPKWSMVPPDGQEYSFEVLKSGQIIDEVKFLQNQPFWVFGRLPANDIEMAHPTISRFHAVLQYRPKVEEEQDSSDEEEEQSQSQKKQIEEGWYIFDLGSTHGTFVNKQRVPPKTYIRVKVGHMLRLGASTRNYILQGPQFDEEPESELTVTELKERRKQLEEEKKKQAEMQAKMREKEGISWGMTEDADEESDLSVNPYAVTTNEELFLDDPKKTLRGYFEREGLNLEYKCDEMSTGNFVCRVELPVDDANGRPIVAEVCHKGKKKECVVQCALEACRILDRHGVLRQSHHEPLKRKVKTADSDDDDDFLDRTGDVQRKKLRKALPTQSSSVTYEELLAQEAELLKNMADIEESVGKYQDAAKKVKEAKQHQEEDLEAFMDNLSDDSKFDKNEIRKLRAEEQRLKAEHVKIQKMIKIAQPVLIPTIMPVVVSEVGKKQIALPLFGKRNKSRFAAVPKSAIAIPAEKSKKAVYKSDEEEMEEDEPVVKEDLKDKSYKEEKKQPLGPAMLPPSVPLQDSKDEESNELENKTASSPLKEMLVEEKDDMKETTEIVEPAATPMEVEKEVSVGHNQEQSKKKRTRQRIRGSKRENVDIDDLDDHEDTEKYSRWLPPQNQSGDGHTTLNDKFGY